MGYDGGGPSLTRPKTLLGVRRGDGEADSYVGTGAGWLFRKGRMVVSQDADAIHSCGDPLQLDLIEGSIHAANKRGGSHATHHVEHMEPRLHSAFDSKLQ